MKQKSILKPITLSLFLVLLLLVGAGRFTQVSASTGTLTLVQIISTSKWSPPSPDPAGIIFWGKTGHLLMSDSEVDEMPNLFVGKNLFEFGLDGKLINTYSTISFTKEPTGVAINPANGDLYVSQDGGNKIFHVDPGADGKPWTSDDKITEFSVGAFGVVDSEDLAFGNGKLFIADGKNTEVWVISPGANGKFDGPPPNGDDTTTHFDSAVLGLRDLEGIAYDPTTGHLWLCSKKSPIVEATISGTFVNSYDISFVNPIEPDGITIAPGSNDPSQMHIWVADRMIDNNVDPKENDGRVYEFAVNNVAPPSNLLLNPGFELDADNNGSPDKWSSNADFTRSSTLVHVGSFSGKHFSSTNDSYNVNQTISGLTPGTMYKFSGWVNIPATADAFTFALEVRWRNSAGTVLRTDMVKTYSAPTIGWDEATANLVAPANTASAMVRMKVTSLNATIYVDDFNFGP